MMKYFWAAVGALVAVTNLPRIFTSDTTLTSLASAFFFAVGAYLAVTYGRKIIASLRDKHSEREAFYDRGPTEGYQPRPGPKPPIPTTGSGVKPPMSEGWQVPQPSSNLPHSTTPVAPATTSSDNNPVLNMGIGALVGGVLGWQLGKSSEAEAETTKEAPAPRAYRLDDSGDIATSEPSYALPAITSEELDRSSPAPSSYDSGSSSYDSGSSSYDSGSSSSYDSGSSSSSDF